jgi:hypothetical protein
MEIQRRTIERVREAATRRGTDAVRETEAAQAGRGDEPLETEVQRAAEQLRERDESAE